jgi:hypothetical protein
MLPEYAHFFDLIKTPCRLVPVVLLDLSNANELRKMEKGIYNVYLQKTGLNTPKLVSVIVFLQSKVFAKYWISC